jgi:hypothetical protein
MNVRRSDLIAAIEQAIGKTEGLTVAEAQKLRIVSWTATELGTCYSTGCPAVVAGLYDPDAKPDERRVACEWASSFDDALMKRLASRDAHAYAYEETYGVVEG